MQTWSRLAHRVLQLNAATLRMHMSGLEDGSTSLGLNMCGTKSIEVCLQIPRPRSPDKGDPTERKALESPHSKS